MTDPLVSVVITSLNRPAWLREATNSVLRQSYRNLEVIIVDDASDDPAVGEVMHDLRGADPRIRVIRNSQRTQIFRSLCEIGPSLRGDYLAILNDDDRWESGFVEALPTPPTRGLCSCGGLLRSQHHQRCGFGR